MTRAIYVVIRDTLLFLFVISLADGVIIVGDTVLSRVVVALIFGALMAALPSLIRFFKFRPTITAMLIAALVVSLAYTFALYMGIGEFTIFTGSVINWGVGAESILRIDAMGTFLFVGIVSAIAAVGLDVLSEAR